MYDEADVETLDRSTEELQRLNDQVRNLRIALRSRQVIDRAVGVLMERYRLPDDEAFAFLQLVSSRFNVKIRALSTAVLTSPRPSRGSPGAWLRDQSGAAEPVLQLIRPPQRRQLQRTGLLNATVRAALEVAGTDHADAQVVESGALHLEVAHGFSTAFVEFFGHLEDDTTPCTRALRVRRAVSVPDVETTDTLAEAARPAVLEAGTRSLYSVPMPAPGGDCVGVFSIHFPRVGQVPSDSQRITLDRIAAEAGAWLHWHNRTAMLGALEYVHQLSTGVIKN